MVSHFLLVVLVASILHVSYATTAYDVLEKNNLPRGLLPNGVKSYILKPDGKIEATLPRESLRKTVFCRVPESSPCALFRAHDEDLLCRVSPEEHTAKKKHPGNLTLRRVPRASTRQTLIFAMGQPVGTRRTWITCGAHPSAVRGASRPLLFAVCQG